MTNGYSSSAHAQIGYDQTARGELEKEDLKAWTGSQRRSTVMGLNRTSTITHDSAQNRNTAQVLGANDTPALNNPNDPSILFGAPVVHDAGRRPDFRRYVNLRLQRGEQARDSRSDPLTLDHGHVSARMADSGMRSIRAGTVTDKTCHSTTHRLDRE
ncbi:hypothetical protein ASA1KI_28670 [Opitutales bacterium ASA1]|uniref:hypothetical protein n=1 Tax=Congregicoccus parvus TaxID=3081749 RepID=UPI002B2E5393|nr:hypothetical protein ASA1KI_28670 [Opitutales bacterium ASA1]